mmetsp:Transcript_67517/g.106947  ORF Transcript_67517/g.106947 Transcript_67517/m.106947 type:complete len:616 (-) Transcript_67517:24-1871(-)|eukprot:CAMPEP_0169116094 /NCGR_PEP_ID=MMETSP1015-20121227/29695_1 /TAXON_ID=342587 /ORGANISM="Karlodinium micrum, Strain CCMP2283" /LENGTH=615 /DNA_ID=CAMNT_0009178595 /DNA_START=63 /DNA_END=1910 /DNA_ORIENTATION=-
MASEDVWYDPLLEFGNVGENCDPRSLYNFFEYFGPVEEVKFHDEDGKRTGFGEVTFEEGEHAKNARERLPPGETCWTVYNVERQPIDVANDEEFLAFILLTEEEQKEIVEAKRREEEEREAKKREAEEKRAARRAAALERVEERKRIKDKERQREKDRAEAEAKRLADLKAEQEAAEAIEPDEPSEVFCKKGGNVRQRTRHGMKYDIFSASFSPDSQQLATSSTDKSVRIWDVKSGREFTVIEHSDYVRCVVWKDATHVCSGCDDKMIRIWRVEHRPVITEEDGYCEHSIKQRDWIVCLRLSPDHSLLCGVSRNQVLLHHMPVPQVAQTRRKSVEGEVGSKETRGSSKTSHQRDPSKESHVSERRASKNKVPIGPPPPMKLHHDQQTFDASFSPDGEMLATASGWEKGFATIWDVASGDELLQIGHVDWVLTAQWSPFGRRILTTSRDKCLRVWDLPPSEKMRCGEDLRLYKLAKEEEERARLEEEQDTKRFRKSKKKLEQEAEAREREELESRLFAKEIMQFGHPNWTCIAAWTPDGKFICSGSDAGNVHLVCVEEDERFQRGQELTCFEQDEPITCVDFGNSGRRVCIASKDGTTRVYGGLHHLWKPPQAIQN